MGIRILKKGSELQKLAHAEAGNKKEAKLYLQGHEDEKIWDTFQTSKKQKREFVRVCVKNNINKSKFIRTCIQLLIDSNGDVGKVIRDVRSSLDSTLESDGQGDVLPYNVKSDSEVE